MDQSEDQIFLVSGNGVFFSFTKGILICCSDGIKALSLNITSISKVDGATSTKIRVTVVPESKDIVPVRNQVLEIDFVNTSIVGEVDTIASGDVGASSNYTTNSSFPTNQAF